MAKVAILVLVILLAYPVQLANATIAVISTASNETVFSAEEVGIDAASAYNLRVGKVELKTSKVF